MRRSNLALLTIGILFVFSLMARVSALAEEWTFNWDSNDDQIVISEDGFEDGGYLGVSLTELDEETAEEAGRRNTDGALILTVIHDTPAHDAGLEAGDIVVGVDRESIDDPDDLTRLIRSHSPGDEVKLRIIRDGRKRNIEVTLAERDHSMFLDLRKGGSGHRFFTQRNFSDSPFAGGKILNHFNEGGQLGVQVRELNEDLAEYFPGADDGGVLILDVLDDTPAEEIGLKSGDVITRLAGKRITSIKDLHKAVAAAVDEGEVDIRYIRKGKQKRGEVEIEASTSILSRLHTTFEDTDWRDHRIHILDGKDDMRELLEKLEKKIERLEKRLEDG
ncbi:MAG: PDZ domain-containing protein [bacterium]|nr:PDZ domain-containing protein [bacterium]